MTVKMNNTEAQKVVMSMTNAFRAYGDNEDMSIRSDDDVEGKFPPLLQRLCERKLDFSVLAGLCSGQISACLLGFFVLVFIHLHLPALMLLSYSYQH